MQILSDFQEKIRHSERQLLGDLRDSLLRFGALDEDQATLSESLLQLDELFLLVVVGEFNAGKSAIINALFGKSVLQEGVTPTTSQITILRYGEDELRKVIDRNQQILFLPVEYLKEISIVDTPGTNAIVREHEILTSEFVPRSDLVLFITSADRPFTESERAFLEKIRDWGKKILIIVNKIDILQNEAELSQVKSYIIENAKLLLGITPEIYLVSARDAMRAKLNGPALQSDNQFTILEKYIVDTLDESSRLVLKFLSPLGVANHLVNKYGEITHSRIDLLKTDVQMLADVEAQLNLYKEDMHRDFAFRMADIENILLEMEKRGDDYFEDIFRLSNVFDLLNKDRIKQGFESKVIADLPQAIERKVNELIDWLVDCDLRQWQAVMEHLSERRRAYQDRLIGDLSLGTFHYDREKLFDTVGREAKRIVETYDKSEEARELASGAQSAVAASAALEVSAVGLGTLITILASTAAADVTGILLAGVIAALGLFIIPAKRRQAKAQMHLRVSELRSQLESSIKGQFEKEIERSIQRIEGSIAPYTRFVRSERGKLEEIQTKFEIIRKEIDRLKADIEAI